MVFWKRKTASDLSTRAASGGGAGGLPAASAHPASPVSSSVTASTDARPPVFSLSPIHREARFEYIAPGAKSVSVVGTFNNWNVEANVLRDWGHGKFTTTISLPPGRYEYRYVVDGEWRSDQRPVESTPNPFGSYNSVLDLS